MTLATEATPKPKRDWLAALLFVGAGLGALGLLGSGLGGLVYAIIDLSQGLDAAQTFLTSTGLLFAGTLLLVPAVLALLRVMGKQLPPWAGWSKLARGGPWVLVGLYPFVLAAGALVAENSQIAWLLLPPIHLLAVAIPMGWLLWLALRKLGPLSSLRSWGALASGMSASPILAFLMEAVVGGGLLVAGMIYISLQPDLARNLERLMLRLSYGNPTLENIQNILEPIAADPVILIGIFGFIALLVPLMEELVKPIGVWLLIRRPLSAREGFALGVLGGAGFGLLENLLQGASAQEWLALTVARLGTTAVHMLTAGLTGWAIVRAKNEKRYWGLLGTYLLSVAIHGTWNFMALGASLGQLSAALPEALTPIAAVVLLLLGLGCVLFLAVVNRRLRVQSPLDS